MQISRYLKIFPYKEQPDHFLLYSTKQASKVLLPEETLQSIENNTLSSSDADLLSELGMIVSDPEAEKRSILSLFDRSNANNSCLSLIVVLNMDCNFACVYCFEGDMKGKHYMSDQTAEQLVDFVKKQFAEHKKDLVVDFYGGEPLLSIGRIKSISRSLKSFTESRGASYNFSLVTNGSLFKRRVAEELASLGLKRVKITIDGPAETHNRYRPFTSGAGSFDAIIKNIKETWDLVKIGIGGNYDRTNHEKFVLLLDYLKTAGLTPDKISVLKFDPISNRPQGDTSPADYQDGCMSTDEPWLAEAGLRLREEILKRGYNTPKLTPISCMVEVADAYVVNYDGCIYKCPAFVGKKDFAVGHLQTGIADYSSIYKLGIWKNEECAACEYLPLCFGGCRYMTFVKNGNIDKLNCQKDYFDASLEALIKQEVTYNEYLQSCPTQFFPTDPTD